MQEESKIESEPRHSGGAIDIATESDKEKIRELAEKGMTLKAIHGTFNAWDGRSRNLSYERVIRIAKRDAPGYTYKKRVGAPVGLPIETIRGIRAMRQQGMGIGEIARVLNLDKSTVSRIANRQRRKDIE